MFDQAARSDVTPREPSPSSPPAGRRARLKRAACAVLLASALINIWPLAADLWRTLLFHQASARLPYDQTLFVQDIFVTLRSLSVMAALAAFHAAAYILLAARVKRWAFYALILGLCCLVMAPVIGALMFYTLEHMTGR
jgi:hypothetical protein